MKRADQPQLIYVDLTDTANTTQPSGPQFKHALA